jgi:hypothetical protein
MHSAKVSGRTEVELLRVCLVGEKPHVTVVTGIWNDPATWGMMLADLARQLAASYAPEMNEDAALARIRRAFEGELAHPTDPSYDIPAVPDARTHAGS